MSPQSLEHYQPLLPASPAPGDPEKEYFSHYRPIERKISWPIPLMVVLLTISALLNVTQFMARPTVRGAYCTSDQQLYTPVQDALEYELKTFPRAGQTSPYHGPPSDAVDKAWEDLYNFGISRIPKSQAALLPNRTIPIFEDEGHYVVSLDVFHQLHCLNMVRQALRPDRYPLVTLADGFDHTDHCVNSIRQSIMCSIDVTPNVWSWDERRQRNFPRLDSVHSCRNFEKIKEWAINHHIHKDFVLTVHMEDDLNYTEF